MIFDKIQVFLKILQQNWCLFCNSLYFFLDSLTKDVIFLNKLTFYSDLVIKLVFKRSPVTKFASLMIFWQNLYLFSFSIDEFTYFPHSIVGNRIFCDLLMKFVLFRDPLMRITFFRYSVMKIAVYRNPGTNSAY